MKNRYSFSLADDGLCITQNGAPLLTGLTGYLKYPGSDYNILTAARQGRWQLAGDRAVCPTMTLELRLYRDGFLLRSSFTNTAEKAITPSCDFTAFAGQLLRTVDRAVINDDVCVNGNRVNEMQGAVQSVRTVYGAVYDSAENANRAR